MILRLRAVEGRTGISRATIYRLIKAGMFPKQVQVSPGAVGWHAEEIDAWVASRPAVGTHTGTQSANPAPQPA